MEKTKTTTIGNKKKRTPKRRNTLSLLDITAFFLLLFFAVLAGISVKDYLERQMANLVQPAWGTIEDKKTVDVLVIREETLIQAPKDGEFIAIRQENERVKEGAAIGYIKAYIDGSAKTFDVLTSCSGTVHYDLDGYEGILNGAPLDELSIDKLFHTLRTDNISNQESDLNTGKGHVVAKIIDSLLDYTVILAFSDEVYFPESGCVSFYPANDNDLLIGQIIDKLVTPDSMYLIMNITSGSDYLTENRYFQADAVINRYSGMIIPSNAIIQDNLGKSGIYKEKSGEFTFCPVVVEGTAEGQSAVSGIAITDKILINPTGNGAFSD